MDDIFKSFVIMSEDGKYLAQQTNTGLTGTATSHHWVTELDKATVFTKLTYPKGYSDFPMLPAYETKTVKLTKVGQ